MAELAIHGATPVRRAPFPDYPVLGDAEVEAVAAAVRTNNLSAQMGEVATAFESEFAAYCGAQHAVATSSGTTALHAALIAAGIGVGDEVIVPPYAFLSTATSVLMQCALPVFADIERQTLGLDPEAVETKINRRTRALIIVHMNGYPADMDGLMAVAEKHGLVVIEDCAHAHGAMYGDKSVGTIGHMGAFSFQQKKNLSLGEGGMVITDDAELETRLRALYCFGPGVPLSYNYRMPELQAAIGRARLPRLDADNDVRGRHGRYLDAALEGLACLRPQRGRVDTRVVYYNYVLHYTDGGNGVHMQRFVEAVRAEGIALPQIYVPIYRHETFKTADVYGRGFPFVSPFYEAGEEVPSYEDGLCPVAEEFCDRRNIEVKIHPTYSEEDVADIAAAFVKVAEHIGDLET